MPNVSKSFVVFFVLAFASLAGCRDDSDAVAVLSAPARDRYTSIDKDGATVIPNGRLVTPIGKSFEVAPHPFGLTLSHDGRIAATANSGTEPLSISVLKGIDGAAPEIMQIPPGVSTDEGVLESVFMGVAIAPDGDSLYAGGGQANKVFRFSLESGEKLGFVDCGVSQDGYASADGYIGDLVLTRDGTRMFAVDQTNFRLLVIDTAANEVTHAIPTGRYPFGVALSPDETKVYVANVGMYEYKKIPGIDENNMENSGLKFPPFAYGSEEAKDGVKIGEYDVPGLGPLNAPESFSVWAFDVSNGAPRNVAKIKTGHLVGAVVDGIPAVGGASPNSIAVTSKHVFVSNGNNDSVTVLDLQTDAALTDIYLKPHPAVKHFRGVIPFGVAVSPDEKRLYVAESGINAIGVIDIPSFKVIGHIPVGWFPSKVEVTPDGRRLVVANAKGYGSGPNGGADFVRPPEGTYIGNLMKGTVSVIDIPSDAGLPALTNKVITNNFRIRKSNDPAFRSRRNNPIPLYGGASESPIKHIVFISKENRTFDEVYGQVPGANGDSTLARYGRGASFSNSDGTAHVENATVMPNHLKLAEEFAIADNFYVDADVSADGHRWLVNTYPNEWVETTTAASYGGNRSYSAELKAPGALAMNGSAGAIYPEDYNEAGSMWEHLQRGDVDFFNFGFGVMFEPSSYHPSFKYTGNRHFINYPVPAPIFDRTSKSYPTYNMAIPDQFRVDQFEKEFTEKWLGEGTTAPRMLTIIIPNDHGADDRPDAGYPFRESYMADNDLAVGRVVEFLSSTPYWKNMLIVITEDDAQNGVDHVDAHRSLLMVISPYAKRGHVGKTHYSFGSIFKTFWNVLGLPYLNQYDAAANDLSEMMTATPDFTPYRAVPVDVRVFDPQKALDPFDEEFDWSALDESPVIDNPKDMLEDSKEKPEFRLEDRE